MIYLPNKFERYTASLRNYIHSLAIKNPNKTKYNENLKKIYLFEAMICNEIMPINLNDNISHLLTAIYFVKKNKGLKFHFNNKTNLNCLINYKSLSALILSICSETELISLYHFKGNLIIKANTKINKHSQIFSKKLNGYVYYEMKTNNLYIKIPLIITDKKPILFSSRNITDYILNPFSEVNIFI